jgi:hypothetical protein
MPRHKQHGGFYPSVMVGVSTAGPFFIPAAISQGTRLIQNNKARMASRRRGSRKYLRRRTKRTRRA